jgi:hypothetical protein
LLVAAYVVPISPIFVTLMKEAPRSPETSFLTRATRRNNPEDTILHSHRRENLKSYTASVVPSSPILVTLMKEALSSSDRFLQEPHGVASQKTPAQVEIFSQKSESLFNVKTQPVDYLPNKTINSSIIWDVVLNFEFPLSVT